MQSSVIANEPEAAEFLNLLSTICSQQKNICVALDRLVLLLQMPSEDVLRVLQGLLMPIDSYMQDLSMTMAYKLIEGANPAPPPEG